MLQLLLPGLNFFFFHQKSGNTAAMGETVPACVCVCGCGWVGGCVWVWVWV